MTVTTAPGAIAPPAYTVTARVLHWVMAALVLVMIPVGIIIANEWGGAWQERLYDLHKSTGLLLVPLIFIRIFWRWTHPPAPLPADIPTAQKFVAHTTHYALYALLVAQPILGWIATSAYPAPLPFYGLFQVPPIWPADNALSEALFKVHRNLGVAIGFVAAMHIGGALYHHFVRKDRVLMRMITGG